MITDKDIEAKAAELSVTPHDVEKDYVHGWVLKGIYSRPNLARQLVLKGGNALRKGYFADTRYSKDLDFSVTSGLDERLIEAELREMCAIVRAATGVQFLDKTVIKDKKLLDPKFAVIEARVYFKGFYNEENVTLKTHLDLTQFDKIYLPIQDRKIIHPYPDADVCTGIIRCHKAEEIIASKVTTLLHRRKVGDLFDLLYAILIAKDYEVNRREVITSFLKKSIFEPQPEAARSQLLAVPLAEYQSYWSVISAPVTTLFNFGFAVENFQNLINSLFSLVVPASIPIPGFAPPAGRIARIGGGAGFGISLAGASFFSSGTRSTIMQAGRTRTMIELLYDGHRRLVEPYKLEYYVRKSDGIGNEYFWGYDTSGGKSGKVGIKQFMCDRIQSVRPTSRNFAPRYSVEL
jgi:predicted nucleotidyltransferase component of viral defense system